MGIEIHQSLSLYDWVVHKFHLNYHRKWLEHLSHPYVPMDIGGECVWVLGEYIDKAKAGFDGFVHSYPFTCMPEVTARTIITNKLKRIYDLPIIYFSFDEHSGMEGFRTRLEAFVDLMNDRRKQEIKNNAEQPVNFIQINATLFQANNDIITNRITMTLVNTLLVNRTSPFEIILYNSAQSNLVDHYDLNLSFSITEPLIEGLNIISNSSYIDDNDQLHIIGEIMNIAEEKAQRRTASAISTPAISSFTSSPVSARAPSTILSTAASAVSAAATALM